MIDIKKVFFLCLTLMTGTVLWAQNQNPSNLTNSPYSRYGIGKLGSVGNVSTRAMGDMGIALRTNAYTNLHNPASLTAIDTLTMIFDAGIDAEMSTLSENGSQYTDWNAGFSYVSFHFPLWRNFAMSLSMSPYSVVGYEYGNEVGESIEGSLTPNDSLFYSSVYAGTGGLQKMMAGIGWRPWRNKSNELNVGVNVAYIFGNVAHGGSISISSGQGQNTVVTREFTARGMELELGVQYTRMISANRNLTFGALFSPKTVMKVDATNMKFSNTDTIQYDVKSNLTTPMKIGAGVTYNIDRKMTVGLEYSFENWSNIAGLDANLSKSDGIYKNISKFAAGIEYQPKLYDQNYLKTCRYRAGLNVKNSYIELYGSQNTEYTISVGAGFPIQKNRSFLNFSAEYVRLEPSKSGLLSENYLRFSLGLTFNEIMFFRNRLK